MSSLTTSSVCVEIKGMTEAQNWLCSTEDHQYATILTDSMRTLEEIRGGNLYSTDTTDSPVNYLASTREEESFTKTVLFEKGVMP